MGRGPWLRRIGAIAALAALAVAACGAEKTLSAQEFVREVNDEGVRMDLGRRLPAGGDAEELHAITLARLPGEAPAPEGEGADSGPNGTLYVFEGSEGAGDELDACRASAGLLCFRAANVVVVMDQAEGGIAAQRLAVAIRRLGSG